MGSKGRTPEQIRKDLAASRHAMSVGIEGLVSQIHPTAVKNQATDKAKEKVEDVKSSIKDTVGKVTGYFYDEYGIRWNNVGTVALAGVCVVAAFGTVGALSSAIRRAVSGE